MFLSAEIFSLIVAGVINLLFGVLVYIKDKKNKNNIFFSLISLGVFFWAISHALFEILNIQSSFVFISATTLYLSAATIPISFLFFVKTFQTEDSKLSKLNKLAIAFFLFILLITAKQGWVLDYAQVENGKKFIEFGPLYLIYSAYIVSYFFTAFYILYKKYKDSSGTDKLQIKYIFLGTVIATSIGLTTNLILPYFHSMRLFWFGPVATITMVALIGYAIIKHNLWNFKLIMIQLFVSLMIITTTFDIFLVGSFFEFIVRATILIIITTLSLLLIKKMSKEAEDKEKLEELTDQLQHANAHLVKMDKQKSEFVSIASHQLRAPIASLKGYSSMALEGSYGKMSDEIKEVVSRIFQSSQSLALIIDDFLNLSRIERGKIEYAFAEANVKDIIEKVISETAPSAETKGIKISLKSHRGNFSANIDAEKIKQVVSNLIDNALKYTPKGSIKIDLSGEGDKIVIKISDTGIGISKENILRLFRKFKRLDNANNGSIKGTGLGLYLAKEIVNAHEGQIWAESKGEGKGTTFCVELKK